MNEREYDELRGERDAAELARIAGALDVSRARAPRADFLARLRADIERETHERRARAPRRLPSFRWALSIIGAGTLALVAALTFPSSPSTAITSGILVASKSAFIAYDPTTLRETARVPVPLLEPWATLAPDQQTLVFTLKNYTREMRILNIHDWAAFRKVPGLDNPHQFALSKDGSRAYVRDGSSIKTVDVAKASVVGTIDTPGVEDSPVYLAPDGRRLFQFLPAGQLIVFDVADQKEVRRVPVDLRDMSGLSASARVVFSPDGSRLYAVGSTGVVTGPIRVVVMDTSTLAVMADKLIDPRGGPALSHDTTPLAELDRALASLGYIAEAKEFGTVTQIALSPDGRTLYAARGEAGEGIVLIDTQRLEPIGRMQSNQRVYALQLSPDGGRLFGVAAPIGPLGSAQLLAMDARGYSLVATTQIRGTSADDTVLLYKP